MGSTLASSPSIQSQVLTVPSIYKEMCARSSVEEIPKDHLQRIVDILNRNFATLSQMKQGQSYGFNSSTLHYENLSMYRADLFHVEELARQMSWAYKILCESAKNPEYLYYGKQIRFNYEAMLDEKRGLQLLSSEFKQGWSLGGWKTASLKIDDLRAEHLSHPRNEIYAQMESLDEASINESSEEKLEKGPKQTHKTRKHVKIVLPKEEKIRAEMNIPIPPPRPPSGLSSIIKKVGNALKIPLGTIENPPPLKKTQPRPKSVMMPKPFYLGILEQSPAFTKAQAAHPAADKNPADSPRANEFVDPPGSVYLTPEWKPAPTPMANRAPFIISTPLTKSNSCFIPKVRESKTEPSKQYRLDKDEAQAPPQVALSLNVLKSQRSSLNKNTPPRVEKNESQPSMDPQLAAKFRKRQEAIANAKTK